MLRPSVVSLPRGLLAIRPFDRVVFALAGGLRGFRCLRRLFRPVYLKSRLMYVRLFSSFGYKNPRKPRNPRQSETQQRIPRCGRGKVIEPTRSARTDVWRGCNLKREAPRARERRAENGRGKDEHSDRRVNRYPPRV